MTAYDRFLVWLARHALHIVGHRFDPPTGRVWYLSVHSSKPHRLPDGSPAPKGGAVYLGFGEQGNLCRIYITREVLEMFRDATVETVRVQDEQYAAVEASES